MIFSISMLTFNNLIKIADIMYRVNINAAYFQSNLKMNSQKNGSTKPKFMLTEQQKQFIQLCLPKGYKLNIVSDTDQKRNRTPRKHNAQFESQYYKKQERKDLVLAEKKSEKKQERKEKQKQHSQSSNSIDQQQKLQSQNKHEQPVKQPVLPNKKPTKTIQKQPESKLRKEQLATPLLDKKQIKIQQLKPSIYIKPPEPIQINKKASTTVQFKKRQSEKKQIQPPIKMMQPKEEAPKIKIQDASVNTEIRAYNVFTSQQKIFCNRFLSKLKSFKSSWPFRQPVDPINQGVPNYLEVIHQPMDLKTIEKKINTNKYEHIAQFHGDINKIFLNSYKFNPKQTNYYTLTMQLQNYYHELLKQTTNNPNALQHDRINRPLKNKNSKNQQDFAEVEQPKKPKHITLQKMSSENNNNQMVDMKQKITQPNIKVKKVYSKPMPKQNDSNRRALFRKVQKLSSTALQSVIFAVFGQVDDEKTTFNIQFQKLSEETLAKIQKIVNQSQKFEDSKLNLPGIQTRMLLF